MIICPLCGKSLSRRLDFSRHLSTIEKNSFLSTVDREKFLIDHLYGVDIVKNMIDSYLLGEVCMYKLKNNVDIRKYLQLAGLKRSSKEERATERYKNTYLTSIQRKYGSSITNISQVEEVHNKKVGTAIRNYGSYENYLKIHRTYMKVGYKEFIQDNDRVKKQFDKCKSTCLRKYGNANFGQGKEAKAKAAKTKKEIITTWSYQERLARSSKARAKVCNRGGYESSIERRVQDILTFLGIPFEKHFHMWHYNYIVEN